MNILFISENGDIIGNADYSEWDKQPFYKKILGFICRKYKNKFIKIKGFKINQNQ